MASTDTLNPRHAPLTSEQEQRAHAAGRLLIAAFLVFAAAVALMIILLPEYNQALENAAQARGVTVNDLQAQVIAPVAHEHNLLWQRLLVFGTITAALLTFVAGIRAATRVGPERSWLARVAVVAGSAMPVAWLGLFALEAGIASADPSAWMRPYDALYGPLIAASTVAGSVAMIAMTVLLRRTDVARRTGLVVLAMSVLLIAVAPILGAPPIVPLLLGAVVGIVLIRS